MRTVMPKRRWNGLTLPSANHQPLSDIGSNAIPISLLSIGVQLDFKNVVQNKNIVVIGVLSRLVVIPLVFMSGAILLGSRRTS